MDARALILAAGHSTRMGHPKALMDIHGQSALARLVQTCIAAGLARPIVVVGKEAAAIREAHEALDIEWVTNSDPDAGRTGSVQCGLRTHQAAADIMILAPVDHPLVDVATIRALLATEGDYVIPTHGDKGGHPIRLGRQAQEAVLRSDPAMPLRDVLAAIRPTRVAVDDPGIHFNLDTPRDLASALEAVSRSRDASEHG